MRLEFGIFCLYTNMHTALSCIIIIERFYLLKNSKEFITQNQSTQLQLCQDLFVLGQIDL